MKEKQRYKAEIAGKTYTIVGNRSTQHLDAVVELVNGQLEQLRDLAPNLSLEDRSILMAINAVSDQIVKEDQIMELEAQLEMAESEINRIRQYQSKRILSEKQNSHQIFEDDTRGLEAKSNKADESTLFTQTNKPSNKTGTYPYTSSINKEESSQTLNSQADRNHQFPLDNAKDRNTNARPQNDLD